VRHAAGQPPDRLHLLRLRELRLELALRRDVADERLVEFDAAVLVAARSHASCTRMRVPSFFFQVASSSS